MNVIDLTTAKIDKTAANLLGHAYAEHYTALPIRLAGDILYVAMNDPPCFKALTDMADITNCFIEPLAAGIGDIKYYIHQTFGADAIHSIASQFIVEEKLQHRSAAAVLLAELNAAPAVQLIDTLIETGILRRASDLHIEPFGRHLRARYRVDGELFTHGTVDISLLPSVISRLKIMGDMDIAEKRMPQDGHFSLHTGNGLVDFRLSTIPTILGEKAVLRLLYGDDRRIRKADLGLLGFSEEDLVVLTQLFSQPYGAVIITGPTGSGKSTTMSAFLDELNTAGRNIVTVEDPVENPLPGVNHVSVSQTGALGFAGALKHILRQDPDVIMIGEIRDEETARIAIQAAMTGHVVLTTLHTNDAAGVIERLTDMGVARYLAAAALNGVISQRLVRRLCPNCRTKTKLTAKQAALLQLPPRTVIYEGTGCGLCHFNGYRGRFAVYEYINFDENLRRAMADDPKEFARTQREKKALRNNALDVLKKGLTSADEIIKVLHRDG